MKLEHLVFDFDKFAAEMANLKENASIFWRIQRATSVAR